MLEGGGLLIIWLNGAYGAGKTTVAEILQKKRPDSYLYDPENIGDFLRDNLPTEMQKEDFQEFSEWRSWNVHILKKISEEYTGDILAPMTLYKQPAFNEVFDGLMQAKITVCHFQLEVSRETLIERLRKRPEKMTEWGIQRVDAILEAFETIPAKEKIVNEGRTPEETAQAILERLPN